MRFITWDSQFEFFIADVSR